MLLSGYTVTYICGTFIDKFIFYFIVDIKYHLAFGKFAV